jgi:phosphoenolpyruvate---glycerone phosphotransferase subunit DhaL
MESVDLDGVKRMLAAAADLVIANRDLLTKADQAIGDGDHGVAMERGFLAARQAIDGKPSRTAGDVFRNVGLAVLGQSGGASGAVFGTFFTEAAKVLSHPTLDANGYKAALTAGLAGVQARGKAKPGDKTMVDALASAIAAIRDITDGDLPMVAAAAARGARIGSEATKSMVASTGKAKTLGDRSVGHVDPGSITLSLVLEGCATSFDPSSIRY